MLPHSDVNHCQEYGIAKLAELASNNFGFALSDALNAADFIKPVELAYANETATLSIRKELVDELVSREVFDPDSEYCRALDSTMQAFPQFANAAFHAQMIWNKKEKQQLKKKHEQDLKKNHSPPEIFSCPRPSCDNVFRFKMAKPEEEYKCTSKSCGYRMLGRVWMADHSVAEMEVQGAGAIPTS